MFKLIITFLGLGLAFIPPLLGQATLITDPNHNQTTRIEALTETAATGLKQFFESPFIEKISKVQQFFKEASQVVSAVVANLRMTRELVETEKEIYQLFVRSLAQIDAAEDFPNKWKHRWILAQLFRESTRIFEVFDLATQTGMGIIDDRGRIQLIKTVLKQAKTVKRAMKSATRRTNRSWYKWKAQQREFETFAALFKHD